MVWSHGPCQRPFQWSGRTVGGLDSHRTWRALRSAKRSLRPQAFWPCRFFFFSIPRTKIPQAVLGVVGVVWLKWGYRKKQLKCHRVWLEIWLEIFGYIMSVMDEPFLLENGHVFKRHLSPSNDEYIPGADRARRDLELELDKTMAIRSLRTCRSTKRNIVIYQDILFSGCVLTHLSYMLSRMHLVIFAHWHWLIVYLSIISYLGQTLI